MNVWEAAKRACEEPTLLDGLTLMANWETMRVVDQALRSTATGERTPDGGTYETCFRTSFKIFMQMWESEQALKSTTCEAPLA